MSGVGAGVNYAAWLAKLEAEPWYQSVRATFASKNIADPLWQSTLYTEDASLDPTTSVVDSNGALSTGLFQLNANGVGAGQSASTLTDPVQNATLAANAMAAEIAREGTSSSSLVAQLQSIERAGWNGGLSQDPTRQANLAGVAAADGLTSTAGFDWGAALNPLDPNYWKPGANTGPTSLVAGDTKGNTPAGNVAAWVAPLQATAQTIALEVTIGAVFLALIAGGFAIAAQSEG